MDGPADPQGNIILGSPYYMGPSTWGARASKEGVVATVEKIVSPDFIRKHSCLVSIPGHIVKSVSEVPFGAHPQGMNSLGLGIDGFRSYRPDIDFIGAYRDTVKDSAKLKRLDGRVGVSLPKPGGLSGKIGRRQTPGPDLRCR